MSEQYTLSPVKQDRMRTTERWTHMLHRKPVTVLHFQVWRWGNFDILLNDTEKERILAHDTIVLNDYDIHGGELYGDRFVKYEILNRDTYDADELEEIRKLMFCEDGYEDEDDEEEFDQYLMEANGWSRERITDFIRSDVDWKMTDTVYEITGGVKLETIPE